MMPLVKCEICNIREATATAKVSGPVTPGPKAKQITKSVDICDGCRKFFTHSAATCSVSWSPAGRQ